MKEILFFLMREGGRERQRERENNQKDILEMDIYCEIII